jgi:hypothetical protein
MSGAATRFAIFVSILVFVSSRELTILQTCTLFVLAEHFLKTMLYLKEVLLKARFDVATKSAVIAITSSYYKEYLPRFVYIIANCVLPILPRLRRTVRLEPSPLSALCISLSSSSLATKRSMSKTIERLNRIEKFSCLYSIMSILRIRIAYPFTSC